MKKTIVAVLVLFVLVPSIALAENSTSWFTNSLPNGNFVLGDIAEGTKLDSAVIKSYLMGVIDCAIAVSPELVDKYYIDMTQDDIRASVRNYYIDNPDKRGRTVVDIVLSGCK